MDFLNDKPSVLFKDFIVEYNSLHSIDVEKARELVKHDQLFRELTVKWYKHLENNELDEAFSVYNDDYYFIDIFQCFKTYSRLFIRQMVNKPELFEKIKNIRSFVDIGCGIAYSTAALKQVFPEANGYAVNLRDTKQWDFCSMMATRRGFDLVGGIDEINEQVDLVFASEFYEHLQNPIAHVRDVVERLRPKYMVIANSFNVWAIGHFTKYDFDGREVDQKDAGREFNKYVRSLGYESFKCGMWNNKPVVWIKQ